MINYINTGIFFLCYFLTNVSLEAAWSPYSVTSSPVSSNSQICIDRFDRAIAIWSNSDQTNTYIQSSELKKNSTWSSPITLSTFPEPFAHIHPQIAIDQEGNATAIWEEIKGSHSIIMASSTNSENQWSTPVEISIPSHRSHQNPKIAMSSSGYAVAIWVRNNGTNNVIESANIQFGESWSPSIVISNENSNGSFPQITVDDLGNAMAVWLDVDSNKIQSARLPFGSFWNSPIENFDPEERSNLKIAMNSSGCAVLIFEQLHGEHTAIFSSALQSDNTWSLPVLVSKNINFCAFDPKVAIDFNGNASLVWSEVANENASHVIIEASYLPRGGHWTTPENISNSQDITISKAHNPDVAFDKVGNAYAVWEKDIDTDVIIESAIMSCEKTWSQVKEISMDKDILDLSNHNPHIAVSQSGYAVVNWISNPKWFNNAYSVIQAATYEADEVTD